MSRKREEESSLELLLDTMCNTFGGVMFIAILLSVTISINGAKQTPQVADPEEKITQVKQSITTLQQELADLMTATRLQAQKLAEMKNDPRLQLVQEIALLEQMCKERNIARNLALQNLNLSRSALKAQEVKTQSVVDEQQKIAHALQLEQEKLDEKKDKLEELIRKIGSVNLKNMYFATLSKKENVPYFIFVNDGKIWPVGPEINGDSYVPDPAVNYQVKDGRFFCYPLPEKAVTVFEGETFSTEFQNFMKNLPAERVPEFVISRSDAQLFFRMREILKNNKVLHGFRMQRSDQDFFDYQFANQSKGSYEY